jgi:hypothetical protein
MAVRTLKRPEPVATDEAAPEPVSPAALSADWSPEEEEIPEVFNLPPLSRKRITVRIREVKPAAFYYGADGYQPEDESSA